MPEMSYLPHAAPPPVPGAGPQSPVEMMSDMVSQRGVDPMQKVRMHAQGLLDAAREFGAMGNREASIAIGRAIDEMLSVISASGEEEGMGQQAPPLPLGMASPQGGPPPLRPPMGMSGMRPGGGPLPLPG